MQSGHNGGFGYGVNFAVRRALASDTPPDYVYLLNSDAFPAEDSIRRLVDHLRSHPEVGIAGSYVHGPDGEPHITAFRFPSVLSELSESVKLGVIKPILDRFVVRLPLPTEDCEVDWVAGCSMLIRREVLDRVGLFDEDFFLYFEETDLCKRAAEGGFKTAYVVDSRVAHIGCVSTGHKEWKRFPSFWFDSRRHYFEKQHGKSYFWGATAARVAGGSLWRARRRLLGKPVGEPERYLRDLVIHSLRSVERARGS
jgi:GT2 family glycosyltransferase